MADSKSSNAGVHNAVGIEFQKHCALFLLFEQYINLKGKKYFICLEHHDDIMFCHQGSSEEFLLIESFQAKKASDKWGMSDAFYEIISKLTKTGVDLGNDGGQKSPAYSHSLTFLTNHAITLIVKQKKPQPNISLVVNEANSRVAYKNLPDPIKSNISTTIKAKLHPDEVPLDQLEHIYLMFIDLPKKSSSQINLLVGYFKTTVNPKIADAPAAIKTLLELFRSVETTLNSGNICQLLDKTKRVTSAQIDDAISIINNNQKAYNLWREDGKDIAKRLLIPIADQLSMEQTIEDSFDFFKDLKQTEHRKILRFTENNKAIFNRATNEVDCIDELYRKFVNENNSSLGEKDLKGALIAAYIETRESL